MKMHTYTVEFRIEGFSLIPSDVTKKLGLEPCQIRERSKAELGKRQRNALWAFDGFSVESNQAKDWEYLEDGLLFLLENLLAKRDLIKSNFNEFDMYWWCGHFQSCFDGGPVFSVELLNKLAAFGVPLYLDNYFSDEDS